MLLARSLRVISLSLGLVIAAAPAVLLAGCADEAATKSEEPQDTPAAKGKDSMDYYRNQTGKKAATKKAAP